MDVVNSEWTHLPSCVGAYWMKSLSTDSVMMVVVIRPTDELFLTFYNVEGMMPITEIPAEQYKFFGPLSLPNGYCETFQNGIYKECPAPVEPKE